MTKLRNLVLGAIFAGILLLSTTCFAEGDIKVTVDGKEVNFDEPFC